MNAAMRKFLSAPLQSTEHSAHPRSSDGEMLDSTQVADQPEQGSGGREVQKSCTHRSQGLSSAAKEAGAKKNRSPKKAGAYP